MSDRMRTVLEAAMTLTQDERCLMAEELLESLGPIDDEVADPVIDEAWNEEILRRIKEANANPSVLVPWQQAREEMFRADPS
jgi:putative addiction module component (TIGR02574 family)